MQNWSCPGPHGTSPTLIPRATPLSVINKVPSIFALATKPATPSADSVGVGDKVGGPLDVSYVGLSMKNIVTSAVNPDPSCLYYEQYCIDEDFFRLGKWVWSCDCHVMYMCLSGDFVYLRSDQEHPFIARIDKMWTDKK